MKHALLIFLVSLCLFTTSCAFTDRMLLSREKTPDGVELFIDHRTGEKTTEAFSKVDGKPNEPAYSSVPSSAVNGAAGIVSAIGGPWGAIAGYGLGILATLYAAIRGKGALNAANAKKAAIKAGMPIVLSIVADWKSGILDADKDGVVSIAEIADYIKKRALASLTPQGIQDILKIISDAVLPEAAKTVALEDIAAEL
jgi:hypothetical protein